MSIFGILIISTVLGLLIDSFRHTFVEGILERNFVWKNYDYKKYNKTINDFAIFIKEIGFDTYKTITEENFYYYEFEYNCFISISIFSVFYPLYLNVFYKIDRQLLALLFCFLFLISISFLGLAIKTYEYYLETMIKAIAKVDKNFKKAINL